MTSLQHCDDERAVKRAALSIAKMVDEYTQRGWNEEGLANFALIVECRLRRFRLAARKEDV